MVGGSLCTPASSITKSGHHDIAEILLKVALNTIISINQSINQLFCYHVWNMNNKTFVNVQWKRNSQYIHNVPQSVSEMIDVIDQPFFRKKGLKIVSRKSKEDRQYNDQKKSGMFLSVRYVEKVFSVGQFLTEWSVLIF